MLLSLIGNCIPAHKLDYDPSVTRVSWRLKSSAIRLFIQQFIQTDSQEEIKLHIYGISWGE